MGQPGEDWTLPKQVHTGKNKDQDGERRRQEEEVKGLDLAVAEKSTEGWEASND